MGIQHIHSEQAALEAASHLAQQFRLSANERDRQRRLPHQEVETFSASGLWAITVPRQYGGIDASTLTLVRVIASIAQADSSIAQIPQSHFVLLDGLKLAGNEQQKRFLFSEVLAGKRIGNAFSETGGKNVLDIQATLTRHDGQYRLNGRKAYATGALFADWIPISAKDENGNVVYAYVPKDSPGLQVLDDWDGLGQRTTASGTVIAENLLVDPDLIVERHKAFETPSLAGPFSQLLHAAIDVGIARGAFEQAVEIVRTVARPWIDSGSDTASQDPYTIALIGKLQIRLHGAEALLERAAGFIDAHRQAPDRAAVSQASVRVAEAKVLANDIALEASNRLFEVGGTRTARSASNYDRHWRDARTHTLHDPVRWKYHLIGSHTLNGTHPPLHVWV